MPDHFRAIGFEVETEANLTLLVRQANAEGTWFDTEDGRNYRRWTPGAGVELWLQIDGERCIGMNPHLAGDGRFSLRNVQFLPDEQHPLDGSLHGQAPLSNDPDDDGSFPILINLPNAGVVREYLAAHPAAIVQVAAFAHEIACFPDEYEFYQAQTEPFRVGSESFIPSGLFSGAAGKPTAEARIAGKIERLEWRVNPFTGLRFLYLLVRTLGGSLDVVAAPDEIAGTPVEGGVVRGSFWLSGLVQDEEGNAPGKRVTPVRARVNRLLRSIRAAVKPRSQAHGTVR